MDDLRLKSRPVGTAVAGAEIPNAGEAEVAGPVNKGQARRVTRSSTRQDQDTTPVPARVQTRIARSHGTFRNSEAF